MGKGNTYLKRGLLVLFFVCSLVYCTMAQVSETGNSHSLTIGAGSQTLSDDILSVSAEKVLTAGLQYSFTSNSARRKKSIMTGFAIGTGNSFKDQLRSSEFLIQYVNAFSIFRKNGGKWKNYTGYSISVNPQYLQIDDQYSWATSVSLSLYNSLSFSWKKSKMYLDLSVPLTGFGSRPDSNLAYKGTATGLVYNSFSDLAFTSWHNLKAVNISLLYKAAVSRHLYFTVGVSYTYKKLSLDSDFTTNGFGIGAGISYRLR
ncbi:MAG: hypothetical protein JNN00_05670 [Chitinophagaceae bacterium]|nr:hypothetical protein [Chitinophagaceae bacterium]